MQLYSERMALAGFDPLPTYIPPHEDPQTRPDLAARFPLQLLSPPRPQFLNSTFANSPSHRERAGEPTVEMAEEDASQRGLADGDWAVVYNDRGQFEARVALTGTGQIRGRRRDGNLLEQVQPRRPQRQRHHVVRPDRHGGRSDVF